MDNSVHIATEVSGSTGVVRLEGRIDAGVEEALLTAYRELAHRGTTRLLLRFASKCSINSAGIAVMITMVSQSRKNNTPVGVFGLSDHYRKIFEMIGLSDYVEILLDEDAVKRFTG